MVSSASLTRSHLLTSLRDALDGFRERAEVSNSSSGGSRCNLMNSTGDEVYCGSITSLLFQKDDVVGTLLGCLGIRVEVLLFEKVEPNSS